MTGLDHDIPHGRGGANASFLDHVSRFDRAGDGPGDAPAGNTATMQADDPEQPARCCPDVQRMEGPFTSGDCPVIDVHRHKGLLRGLVLDGGAKPRALCWHRDGRLSAKGSSPLDLRRGK